MAPRRGSQGLGTFWLPLGGAAGGSRGKEGPLGETGELVAWSCLPVGPAERWVTGQK